VRCRVASAPPTSRWATLNVPSQQSRPDLARARERLAKAVAVIRFLRLTPSTSPDPSVHHVNARRGRLSSSHPIPSHLWASISYRRRHEIVTRATDSISPRFVAPQLSRSKSARRVTKLGTSCISTSLPRAHVSSNTCILHLQGLHSHHHIGNSTNSTSALCTWRLEYLPYLSTIGYAVHPTSDNHT
jgi:hypothetical protein